MDWMRLFELIIPIIVAFLASSGFWMFMEKTRGTREISRKLLIGLAHDRIVYLSLCYIKRGSITQDEYENLAVFLYRPYIDIGGNGSAIRLMSEVDKLPIINTINLTER